MRLTSLLSVLLGFTPLLFHAQPTSWSPRGVGGGGALFSPAINPANPDEYYVACDLSALFHTTDYGLHYNLVHFNELQGGHNSKVCYTATPGLLYCVHYANDQVIPMKSTDNGITWNPLPGNPDEYEETFSIWADYNHPDRVIVAYYGQVYFSNNGGTSFNSIHTALDNGAGCLIGGAFFDGNNIYLGTNDGILVSTNAGANWSTATITGIPSNERISSFAAAKTGGVTRFFCLTGGDGDVYVGLPGSDYYGFLKGVYSCDYGTTNWTPRMTGITQGSDFLMFVDMAENDINTVYLAGSNDNSVPVIMKSTDAGAHWNNTFLTTNNQNINTGWSGAGGDRNWTYGECPFGFDVAANNANRVIFGDFGFMHKTSDGGQTWQQAYVDPADQHPVNQLTPPKQAYHSVGLENTTCWQVHWANATTMFACYSDIRGIRSTDGGQTWSFNYTGSNANTFYRIAQSTQNGTLYAATSAIHDMYQSTRLADSPLDNADSEGKLLFSSDNGATWQLLHNFGHPVFWVALDPNNPNRAYAAVIHYGSGSGIGGVYRCDNLQNGASSTWTLLSDPPRTQKHPASIVVLNDGTVVCTFSGRRNNSGFTNSSGVFTYNPSTGAWTDVSDPGMYYWTKDIVVDPGDPGQNTWYAAVFSGWGGAPNGLGGLYRTINRGQSWTKLTGSQFDRVTSITFNPLDNKQVYLTTEQQGLWICNNVGIANPVFTQVQGYNYRQPERVFFNPFNNSELWVSSFGNGMRMGNLVATGTQELPSQNALNIYPNPVKDVFILQSDMEGSAYLHDLEGRLIRTFDVKKGMNQLNIHDLETGTYMLRLNGATGKVLKD